MDGKPYFLWHVPCGNHAGKSDPQCYQEEILRTKFEVVCFSLGSAAVAGQNGSLERFGGITMREPCGLPEKTRFHKIQNRGSHNEGRPVCLFLSSGPQNRNFSLNYHAFWSIWKHPIQKPTKIVGTSAMVTFFSHARCERDQKTTQPIS